MHIHGRTLRLPRSIHDKMLKSTVRPPARIRAAKAAAKSDEQHRPAGRAPAPAPRPTFSGAQGVEHRPRQRRQQHYEDKLLHVSVPASCSRPGSGFCGGADGRSYHQGQAHRDLCGSRRQHENGERPGHPGFANTSEPATRARAAALSMTSIPTMTMNRLRREATQAAPSRKQQGGQGEHMSQGRHHPAVLLHPEPGLFCVPGKALQPGPQRAKRRLTPPPANIC